MIVIAKYRLEKDDADKHKRWVYYGVRHQIHQSYLGSYITWIPCLAIVFMKGNRMEKDYFVHESNYIDDDVIIGTGTKIWHFCRIQKGARIGAGCSLGQRILN